MKILITCPPMLGQISKFKSLFSEKGIDICCPEVVQTLSVDALKRELPNCDGWIIGDDPANKEVFEAGQRGRLKAAVKWGVGVDNVDFAAAEALGILTAHTPYMFGSEVADIAMGYVTGLARQTYLIDRKVRQGEWVKPAGISLEGKTVALVGFGDIGQQTAKRLLAAEMRVIVYDPFVQSIKGLTVERAVWPNQLHEADFIVLTCALTKENFHMINRNIFDLVKKGVRLINVARGPLIDESALVESLSSGLVGAVALDVFEHEPLHHTSQLLKFEQCIFGAHNASNTIEAVLRTSYRSIELLFNFLVIYLACHRLFSLLELAAGLGQRCAINFEMLDITL